MNSKEAEARIKINKLLEDSGWLFFDDGNKKANVQLEQGVKLTSSDELESLGTDFEKSRSGYVDYLLIDGSGFPFAVLEAKRENKDPLNGKEQARRYAKGLGVRFIILSNGNIHYFWDLKKGNPHIITRFPTPESITRLKKKKPNPHRLINEKVSAAYILHSQNPNYASDPEWLDPAKRDDYLKDNNYRLLRDYQLQAIHRVQQAVAQGNDRFLFEMATGTGKTLVAAAVIRLFLRTGNAIRALFLVDRIELENQAETAFKDYLKKDYPIVTYKKNRNDWHKAKIVISTVQSLVDKYQQVFSPTDFDLIISDEAHRSINGNARAIFEYFGGYKLGLTATPKNYLKNIELLQELDPRAYEKRLLLDTYKTFGCEDSDPTFRYTLNDGVKDGYLLSPYVVDARTEITTQLLSDEGYAVLVPGEDGNLLETIYTQQHFEKRFFSGSTNRVFCDTFIKHAYRDPISGEIGKTIFFCVSQDHAAKITKILNELAESCFPEKYQSDFAVQVTSRITDAQQLAKNFQNNNLNGYTKFAAGYKNSRTRVCVTVGMMTTGYDCTDIMNICLLRPIFSPSDFIQIKGRGTRRHGFKLTSREKGREQIIFKEKESFKLFDFFANCEYFEEKFNYDEVLKLPKEPSPPVPPPPPGTPKPPYDPEYEYKERDYVTDMQQRRIGAEGMKVDRKMFEKFAEQVKEDPYIQEKMDEEDFQSAQDYIAEHIFNKPEEYFDLEKLRKDLDIDWRMPFRQILEYIFGHIDKIKGKHEVLDDEFDKFISIHNPDSKYVQTAKRFFKAYIIDEYIRSVINSREYAKLATNPVLTMDDIKELNGWREVIPKYVKDYVPLNNFMQ